jgi:ferritin-like metal-binding protein YciE
MGALNLEQEFKPVMSLDRGDMGKADSLRYNVLTYVAQENYDKAIEVLNEFLNQEFDYPPMKIRISRYIEHAVDVVNAIRAKRRFPGVKMLTMAKQKELNEKFKGHLDELQYMLKKVEKIHQDLRIEDVRSTVWVVKVASFCAFALIVGGFIVDVQKGLFTTAFIVTEDVFTQLTNWLLNLF